MASTHNPPFLAKIPPESSRFCANDGEGHRRDHTPPAPTPLIVYVYPAPRSTPLGADGGQTPPNNPPFLSNTNQKNREKYYVFSRRPALIAACGARRRKDV